MLDVSTNWKCPISSIHYLILTYLYLFLLIAVIITLGFPEALKHWTNEQVLNFIHTMWDKNQEDEQEDGDPEVELDPLNFLPNGQGRSGPLEATVVVEVAKKAYETLVANGVDIFSRRGENRFDPAFDSPLASETITFDEPSNTGVPQSPYVIDGTEPETVNLYDTKGWQEMPTKQACSFVAPPESNNCSTKQDIPDPARKQRIVEWLCSNIQHLNELSQVPFSSRELWRLHQHYFTPVVNESGGAVHAAPGSRIILSVPEVSRGNPTGSAVTPSTQSSEDQLSVPVSDPVFPGSPGPTSLPMLKRKVSYRFLGDAAVTSHAKCEPRLEKTLRNSSVARMIEEGHTGHSLPPKTKKARRNRTRISFLPRVKVKLDSYLDVCHEKALITMQQLYHIEQAILGGHVNPLEPSESPRTHLSGILASEAEMIIVDMI